MARARHEVQSGERRGFVVLGNQLFAPAHLAPYRDLGFFMAEDYGLCTHVRHHKQKLVLFLAAMRSYRDALRDRDFDVTYHALPQEDPSESYEARLARWIDDQGIDVLLSWEVEDKFFETRLERFCEERGLGWEVLQSPMFLTSREEMDRWLSEHRPFMGSFYRFQRERLGLLLDDQGNPTGGRWSYDSENRERLPEDVPVPEVPSMHPGRHVREVAALVEREFASHPGELDLGRWWLPVSRRQALHWLDDFLRERFAAFGPYEDALSTRGAFLFHSALSPCLNLGLLTPDEVVDRARAYADAGDVPLPSLEGFVRQIIGWREFIRGVYRRHSDHQEATNFFGHRRSLTAAWWDGTTGLLPLDDVIRKAWRYGYAHHIERLMVVGNLMTLCEIEPVQAHRWFMEMFVDSSDWVMGPNVYGMALFSDGGLFATKPYVCGSNYILKMSDYSKPRANDDESTWADTLDGLYWRFVDRHRQFFVEQARLAHAVKTLERMKGERRSQIFEAAEAFLDRVTG